MLRRFFNTLLIAGALSATTGYGEWRSKAHLGFAVNHSNDTRVDQATGSLLCFDLTHVWGDLSAGLRSLSQGGESEGQRFYRLTTGPVFEWNLEKWSLHGAIGTFQERGTDQQGETQYQSHGHSAMIGWQRNITLSNNASFAWGPLFQQQEGSMVAATGQARSEQARSWSKGMLMTLSVDL